MKLALYIGTRQPWYIGLGNRLVRLRLRSPISHCELVFEPGDEVDDLMPDGTTAPDASGALWCASSGATDPIPAWSKRRAGKAGGVRLKRIHLADSSKWVLIDLPWANARAATRWFQEHEGALYDWQGIFGFVAWPIPNKTGRWACHAACAAALGFPEPNRLDPASLAAAAIWRNS